MKMQSSLPKIRSGALYIRVSTDRQEELSPDAQKRLLLDYAAKNNIQIKPEHIFTERGISGRKAEKRPEFQRMIALARSSSPSPFCTILLWKFSRFARNQEEAIFYKSMLRKQCNIEVISISEPLIEGPFGSLIERIIEWMDEYYSVNLSGEVIRGMTENALRGGYQTTPPLGYRAAGNGRPFLIDSAEAPIVQYIFEQYCRYHREPSSIAGKLNDMGARTRRGSLFDKRNISYILQNSFYIGELKWNGITATGTHETFIPRELFMEARRIHADTFIPAGQRNLSSCRHWLSGIVKCSICGASLSYNKCRYPFFNCWKYAKGYHRETSGISEKNLVNAVLLYFKKLLNGSEFTFFPSADSEESSSEISCYKAELEKIAFREQKIRYAFETGVDSLEEYEKNKGRLQEEKNRLEELLSQTEKKLPEAGEIACPPDGLTVYEFLREEQIPYETKGLFIRALVQKIVYDKESGTLTFYLHDG